MWVFEEPPPLPPDLLHAVKMCRQRSNMEAEAIAAAVQLEVDDVRAALRH